MRLLCNHMYYVYQYIDPISNLPFYIGKGCKARKYAHLKETIETTDNVRKFKYIEELRKKQLLPIIEEVNHFDNEQDAYTFEELLIVKYGRKGIDPNGILTNITLGSNPPSRLGSTQHFSEKHRKKLSEASIGKKKLYKTWQTRLTKDTDIRIYNMSVKRSKTGNPHLIGRKYTKEHCENISKGQRGKIISNETKLKMSQAKKGKTWEEIFGEEGAAVRRQQMRSGADHYNAKKINTPAGVFSTITQAVDYFKVSDYTIRKRCKSSKEKWKEWYYI